MQKGYKDADELQIKSLMQIKMSLLGSRPCTSATNPKQRLIDQIDETIRIYRETIQTASTGSYISDSVLAYPPTPPK